jgi:hypothetical protein
LDALKVRWALIGGLAISVRSVPRFTKDLDFAIAVANDSEAEDVVHRLRGRGYQPVEILEQNYVERLSGVRLERDGSDVIVDLLILAGRNQDLTDLGALVPSASAGDLDTAREAVRLIQARGFNREQDVAADLDKLISDLGR